MALRRSVRPDGSWRPTCFGCFQPFDELEAAVAPKIATHPGALYHLRCLPDHYVQPPWVRPALALLLRLMAGTARHAPARPARAPRKGMG